MKFLTMQQSQEWLGRFGGTVAEDRSVLSNSSHGIETLLPSGPPLLANFLERAVDWLPRGKERLLWLINWSTYPPHSYRFFEAVWTSLGGFRPLIETPGCLFVPDHGDVNQEFSEEPDTTALIGLSLLVVDFDWRACIVSEDGVSRIDFSDECILFSTSELNRLKETRDILDRFALRYKHTKGSSV